VALGQILFEYFGFPANHSFHKLLHNHCLSSRAATIGNKLSHYLVDLVPPQLKKKPSLNSPLRSVHRLLVTASVVPTSLSLVALMKEALSSSETSVLNKSHTA
jgi:hypothetical protein